MDIKINDEISILGVIIAVLGLIKFIYYTIIKLFGGYLSFRLFFSNVIEFIPIVLTGFALIIISNKIAK